MRMIPAAAPRDKTIVEDARATGYLPPLSLEAYKLRVRLSQLFMAELDPVRRMRLLDLVVRADGRFERRESKFRAEEGVLVS